MKKVFTFLVMCFFVPLFFAPSAVAGLWLDYYQARESAQTCDKNGLIDCAIDNYLKAGNFALQLKRRDIAEWQFSNAAFALIEHYGRTGDKEFLKRAEIILDGFVFTGEKVNVKVKRNRAFIKWHLKH